MRIAMTVGGLVLLIGLSIVLKGTTTAHAAETSRPPNIVLIISDDQAYQDFGFMGSQQAHTPNLDELAAQAAFFPNAYVPTSVCRPSLATILTGHYPHEHGIFFNHPPPGLNKMREQSAVDWVKTRASAEHFIRDMPTIPRLLAKHGYACLQTGKLWEGDYANVGFTEGMTLNKASAAPAYGNREVKDGVVAHGNGDAGLKIGRDTMQPIYDFVERNKQKPLFIWYAPMMPHLPYDGPQRYRDAYEYRTNVPAHLVGYFGEITRFDDTVGKLLHFMKDQGLADNTLYIFLADNGFRPAEPSVKAKTHEAAEGRSKLSPYESGIRTPFLVYWPGHTRSGKHEQIVQSVDVLPTILAAAGITDAGSQLPGVNLLPAAEGAKELEARPAFGEIYPNDAAKLDDPQDEVLYRWVRDGDLKLIERVDHSDPAGGKVSSFSLYDLANDPNETHDLAADKHHSRETSRLQKLLDEWWTLRTAPADQDKVQIQSGAPPGREKTEAK